MSSAGLLLIGVTAIAGVTAVAATVNGKPPVVQALPPSTYIATVDHVRDGDTISVHVPAWENTPFADIGVRVYGIDTPEHTKPPAKCMTEVSRGLQAMLYARTMIRQGDQLTITYHGQDKYGGRIDADVRLPDGRDWGQAMVAAGYARPYDGGAKASWCHR